MAVNGDGIIGKAQQAKAEYQNAQAEEQNILDKYLAEMEGLGANNTTLTLEPIEIPRDSSQTYTSSGTWRDNGDGTLSSGNITIAIGEYVNYTYDSANDYELSAAHSGYDNDQSIAQTTDMKWRVMGVSDNGELELISETPTSSEVGLQGATGYNNGVYILNDICKTQYSNSSLGITARSLNIEDIEKRFSEEGRNVRDSFSNAVQYGQTHSYSSTKYYPTLYAEEAKSGVTGTIRDGGISQRDPFYTSSNDFPTTAQETASSDLMATQTYYDVHAQSSYFNDGMFNYPVFGTNSYFWLGSRYVDCYSDYAYFGLRYVDNSSLIDIDLFLSDGGNNYSFNFVRPAVSLTSNITVTGTGEKIGSQGNMWSVM